MMMSPSHDGVQISSDAVALALSGVALAVLLHTKVDSWTKVSASHAASQSSIEVTVQTEAAPTPTPPTPPPPVQKPVPRRVVPQFRVAEIPVPADAQPQISEPVPEGAALVASATVPAPAPVTRPDLEAEYAASLRADIDRRTHAPDSAQYRLRRPFGEVRVGFAVMRDGAAKGIHVLRSSGSSILDDAAQTTVSSGHYPAMPAKAFAGEAEHMFAVTIEYRRSN
ncbi:MAG TPA: TonB family protein [Steroidobacteraceae bacterium]